jgi:hypothetical protein
MFRVSLNRARLQLRIETLSPLRIGSGDVRSSRPRPIWCRCAPATRRRVRACTCPAPA